jgi:hypothetical protein
MKIYISSNFIEGITLRLRLNSTHVFQKMGMRIDTSSTLSTEALAYLGITEL